MKKYLSVSQFQSRSHAGWSRRKKFLFYGSMGLLGFEIYTQSYKTDIKFTLQPTQFNVNAINACPSLVQGVYKPTAYLFNSFLQSVYGAKIDPVPYVPFQRKIIECIDGGQLTIDSLPVHTKYLRMDGTSKEDFRVLIILHGITGASESNYIRHAALFANRKGFKVFCVNMRGYSHSKLTTAKPTDYTKLHDLKDAIDYIKEQCPQSKLYMMGFSMGSNMALRYIQQDPEIRGAVAVSTPWNINDLAKEIERPTKRIYDYSITQNFIRNMKWNLDIYEKSDIDLSKALKATKTKEFDEIVTRRLLGYGSVDEMYSMIDCPTAIKDIKIPVLLISSLDDPVINSKHIPRQEILDNQNLILAQTQAGGHIEWFTGFRPMRWINKPAIQFLDYVDKNN